MTAAARFVIRTARDERRRIEVAEADVPLARWLPPIDQRGREWDLLEARRQRRRRAEELEALADQLAAA